MKKTTTITPKAAAEKYDEENETNDKYGNNNNNKHATNRLKQYEYTYPRGCMCTHNTVLCLSPAYLHLSVK